MCGVSGPELIIVVVAAVIVLGPDRLPDVMRMVGRLLREVRKITGDLGRMTDDVTAGVSVEDLKRQLREEMGVERVRERRREVESEIDQIRARLKEKLDIESKPTTTERRELREKFGAAADSIEPPPSDAASPEPSTPEGGEPPAGEEPALAPTADLDAEPPLRPPVAVRAARHTVPADAPPEDAPLEDVSADVTRPPGAADE